jgi:cyclic-di-AMP phosphodiesterase PgpH
MPAPKRKTSSRQKEIRRSKAERRQPLFRRVNARAPFAILALGLIVAALAAVIVSLGGNALTLRVGQHLERALTARVNFSLRDQSRTTEKRVQARDASPNYYRLDTALVDGIRGRLNSLLTIAQTHKDNPAEIRKNAANIKVTLDDEALQEFVRLAELEDPFEYQQAINTAIDRLRQQPLVERSGLAAERTPLNAVLVDQVRDVEPDPVRVSALRVADRTAAEAVAEDVAASFARPLRAALEQSLVAMLTTDEGTIRPLYLYDSTRTIEEAEAAYHAVELVMVEYPVGAIIANAGEITPEEFAVLKAEHEAWTNQAETPALPTDLEDVTRAQRFAAPAVNALGRSLLALFATLGIIAHYLLNRRAPQINLARMATTAGTLLLLLLFVRLVYVSSDTLLAHFALGPHVFAAALLVIVYRRHQIVLPLMLTFSILVTLAIEQGLGFFFILFATCGSIAIALSDVRARGQIVGVGTIAALVAIATTFVVGLIRQQPVDFVLWQSAWAAGATLAAAFMIEGLLPAIERLFMLSTSLTLLEWCDATKPLQRMMAAEAPGTYNHSLQVGTLAESAAEAIGANGLLCRAGAYYHDIGKINKPGYFVENQALTPNRHDRLSPAMSLLIIIGHVKDGIEMAKEYGLPHDLRPFIAEHHGTTLVEYFYHAASKSRRPDDPMVSDTEFRYPGPKPQTRESGILMLCDGVEGAVRAMPEPTPGRIEDTVNAIVQKRLMDGQFDECDLTFREIGIIRRTLTKTLSAIYHSRIQYPSEEKPAEPAARGASA